MDIRARRHSLGSRIANSVAQRLVMAPHRHGGQAQYVVARVPEQSGSRIAEWRLTRDPPDLVRSDDGTLHLLELELVEPELFFRLDASLGECLAAHLQWLVGRRDDY